MSGTSKQPRRKKAQEPPALRALRRAAKQAIELARQTGTPAHVMVGDKIVDATKLRSASAKNGATRTKK